MLLKQYKQELRTSNVVQITETRGTITLNAAVDVDSSAAENNALLIWNTNTFTV